MKQQENLKAKQECEDWSCGFEQEILDMAITDSFADSLFGFIVHSPLEEPIPREDIIVELPISDITEEDNFVLPVPEDIVHIDFIFGDFFEEHTDGPKVQDFLPQFKLPVFYF